MPPSLPPASPTPTGAARPTATLPARARTALAATAQAAATTAAQPTPTFTAPSTQRQLADRPDDHDGFQVHFLYVLPADAQDEGLDANGWIATAIGAAMKWLERESGGRRLSVDTYQGELDITFVRLGRPDAVISAYDSRTAASRQPLARITIEVELRSLGFDHPRKVYGVYYGGGTDTGECFGGSYPPSRPGNIGMANVKLDGSLCEGARKFFYPDGTQAVGILQFHEIFHTLGAVGRCAPHHSTESGGHVSDDPRDLMFPKGSRTAPPRFDAGRDDYFGHGNPGCLDLARSPFLLPAPPNPELPPSWPIGVARPHACEEESKVGTTEASGTQSGIIFDNMRDATAQVFQLTPQGRTLRETVRAWTASYQLSVPPGTAYLVADEAGKCLGIYVAEAAWTRATVRDGG